jgi:PadR family transcriptional regulator PadR
MAKGKHLGEFEQLVMLAVLRLGDEAYGMSVRRELQRTARRSVTIGSVYGTLDRLEAKGLMASWKGEPDPVRGGRARRYFRVERAGEVALAEARARMRRMWEGVEVASDGST